jgi:hypothetical protein
VSSSPTCISTLFPNLFSRHRPSLRPTSPHSSTVASTGRERCALFWSWETRSRAVVLRRKISDQHHAVSSTFSESHELLGTLANELTSLLFASLCLISLDAVFALDVHSDVHVRDVNPHSLHVYHFSHCSPVTHITIHTLSLLAVHRYTHHYD